MTAPTRTRRRQPPADKQRVSTQLTAWCQRCDERWSSVDGSSHPLANAASHAARTGHKTTVESKTTYVFQTAASVGAVHEEGATSHV